MNAKLLMTGDYISAVELGEKTPTLTVKQVKLDKLEQEDGKKKNKGIIFFREIERGWVLNKTNILCLVAMFGDETDRWVGKRITVFATLVQMGPKKELGIRIKGSPDIAEAIDASIKLPRKKPITMRLVPTGKGVAPAPEPVVGEDIDPPIPPDELTERNGVTA